MAKLFMHSGQLVSNHRVFRILLFGCWNINFGLLDVLEAGWAREGGKWYGNQEPNMILRRTFFLHKAMIWGWKMPLPFNSCPKLLASKNLKFLWCFLSPNYLVIFNIRCKISITQLERAVRLAFWPVATLQTCCMISSFKWRLAPYSWRFQCYCMVDIVNWESIFLGDFFIGWTIFLPFVDLLMFYF